MELTKAELRLLNDARRGRGGQGSWAITAGTLVGLIGCLLIISPHAAEYAAGTASRAAIKDAGFVLVVAGYLLTNWWHHRFRIRALSVVHKLAALQGDASVAG